MAELRITEYELGRIALNFDEIKAELTEKVKVYKTMVYNEESIRDAKNDRAKLNALKKALADERIRRKKEFLEPYNEFEGQVKELEAIIDEPAQIIDRQVKEYDERVKTEKRKEIARWVEDNREELKLPHWIVLHRIFNEKWLNATCSAKTWQGDLMAFAEKLNGDIATIEALPEFSFEAMEAYKESLDLGQAMREGKRLADIQKAKEAEQKAKEAEQRAREQAEEAQKILADKVRGSHSAQEAEIQAFQERLENDKAALEKGKNEGVKRWWVNIRACVTLEQSKDIKGYFEANGIEYTAMTERN